MTLPFINLLLLLFYHLGRCGTKYIVIYKQRVNSSINGDHSLDGLSKVQYNEGNTYSTASSVIRKLNYNEILVEIAFVQKQHPTIKAQNHHQYQASNNTMYKCYKNRQIYIRFKSIKTT